MQNITLSANAHLIEQARSKAKKQHTSLNAVFRQWLEQYAQGDQEKERKAQQYEMLMKRLDYVSTGGKRFTRDEMNER